MSNRRRKLCLHERNSKAHLLIAMGSAIPVMVIYESPSRLFNGSARLLVHWTAANKVAHTLNVFQVQILSEHFNCAKGSRSLSLICINLLYQTVRKIIIFGKKLEKMTFGSQIASFLLHSWVLSCISPLSKLAVQR